MAEATADGSKPAELIRQKEMEKIRQFLMVWIKSAEYRKLYDGVHIGFGLNSSKNWSLADAPAEAVLTYERSSLPCRSRSFDSAYVRKDLDLSTLTFLKRPPEAARELSM